MRMISTSDVPLFSAGDVTVGFTRTITGDGGYDGNYREKLSYWIEQEGHRRASSRAEIDATISATRCADAVGLAAYFVHVHRLGRLATSDSTLVDFAALTGRADIDPVLEDTTLRFVTLETPEISLYGKGVMPRGGA
jgi:hypothetical protein